MFCIHCGIDFPSTSEFCAVCGRPTSMNPAAPMLARPAYAGFWLRLVASILDTAIFLPVIAVALIPLFLAAQGIAASHDPNQVIAVVGLYAMIALLIGVGGWLYFTLMESSRHQGTLGKKALGLIVTDMDGNRISFGRANGRYFAKTLSGFIFNIGYIMAGFTEKKQALHDMIASCLVLRRGISFEPPAKGAPRPLSSSAAPTTTP